MAGNLEVTDLPLIPAVDGADVYAAKNNLDYRIRTGEAGGLATLDGSGKLPTSQFPTSLTLTNITFTGTPQYFRADFTTPGASSYFQTTTVNGSTNVTSIPNGTSPFSAFSAYNTSNTTNYAGVQLSAQPTAMAINSINGGSGILRDITFQFNGTAQVAIGTTGNVTANGNITANGGTFTGAGNVVLATNAAGGVFLRPNGPASAVAQSVFQNSSVSLGAATTAPTVAVTGGLALLGNTSGLGANEHLINFASNRWLTYSTVSGRWQFGSSGNLEVAGGSISSLGGAAGVIFQDRSSSRLWQWYGTGDVAWLSNGGANIVAVDASGVMTATNFIASSDRNLKSAITDKQARRGLADKLRLVDFIWKATGNKDQGLIAQEVKDVAPEYVHTTAEGTLAIDKVGLLLECVVDLAARVRELEDRGPKGAFALNAEEK